jgi:uncharacterized peroxidase-related enzyme
VLVYHLQHDHTLAEVEPEERAMLDYAVKLNREPARVCEADLKPLRDAGFDDQGMMDIVMIVSLFNFMNRLADGLGVQTEPAMEKNSARGEQRAREALQLAGTPTTQAGGS